MTLCCLCGDRIGDTDVRTVLERFVFVSDERGPWQPPIERGRTISSTVAVKGVERALAHTREYLELDAERRARRGAA